MAEPTSAVIASTHKPEHQGVLRRRLVFTFVVLVLLPMLTLGIVSSILDANVGTQHRLDQLHIIADFKTRQVVEYLQHLQVDIQREVAYFEDGQLDFFHLSRELPEFHEVYVLQRGHLMKALQQYADIDTLLLLDVQGQVLISTNIAEEDYVYIDEDYFKQGLEGLYVQPPDSRVAARSLLILAHPICDNAGVVVGVFVVRVNMDGLARIMVQAYASVDEAVEMYLIDVDADAYNLLTPLNTESQSHYTPNSGVEAVAEKQNTLSGKYDNYAGKRVLACYRWIPELASVLVVESPLDAVRASSLSIVAVINRVMMFVVLGLAILVGVWVVHRIIHPIAALSEVALHIAEGTPVDMVALDRHDEIGTLARAFDRVTQQLREQIASLELRVAERTIDLQQRATELESTSYIVRQMTAVQDIDALLSLAVQEITKQFDFQHVGVFLLNDTLEFAQLRAASSIAGKEAVLAGYKVMVGSDDLVGSVARLGQARILHLASTSSEAPGRASERGRQVPAARVRPRSQVALPLIVRDRVLGVVDVHSQQLNAFSYDNIVHLQTMTEQLSLVLDNLRLLSAAEAQLGEIQQLMRSQSQDDWSRLIQNRAQWGYGYDGTAVKPREQLPIIQPPQFTMPIKGGTEVIGQLKIFDEQNPLNASDMELVQTVAEQAGQALESARLFNKMQTALEEVGVLYRGSQALGAARTSDEVLRAFVDYLTTPEINRCVLALLEPQSHSVGGIVRVEAAWDAGKAHSSLIGDRWLVEKIPAMKETTQLPLAISDVQSAAQLDDASRQVFREILRVRAFVIVPLRVRETLLGWLLVASLRKPYTFSEREIRIYRSMADQAAIVVQSIRLIADATQRAEREHRITSITAEIRRHTDVDAILQTSIRELGHTLQASDGLIRLGVGTERRVPKTQSLEDNAQ